MAALLRQIRRVAAGQQALRESEERYALAMEGANEGHWDWDVTTGSLILSPQMKLLSGQTPDTKIDTRAEWLAKVVIQPNNVPRFEAELSDHLQRISGSDDWED